MLLSLLAKRLRQTILSCVRNIKICSHKVLVKRCEFYDTAVSFNAMCCNHGRHLAGALWLHRHASCNPPQKILNPLFYTHILRCSETVRRFSLKNTRLYCCTALHVWNIQPSVGTRAVFLIKMRQRVIICLQKGTLQCLFSDEFLGNHPQLSLRLSLTKGC